MANLQGKAQGENRRECREVTSGESAVGCILAGGMGDREYINILTTSGVVIGEGPDVTDMASNREHGERTMFRRE